MKHLIFILISIFLVSSCGFPKRTIRKVYRFDGEYTGLDTMINLNGHYNYMFFYDNGLVIDDSDLALRYNGIYYRDNFAAYLQGIAGHPDSEDAKDFYNIFDCGSYVVSGDTIKQQKLHQRYSWVDYVRGYEYWYKIIDRNTLQLINKIEICYNSEKQNQLLKERVSSNRPVFKFEPLPVLPNPDCFWILKRKWFWTSKQKWKAYMKKLKLEKKMKQKEKE